MRWHLGNEASDLAATTCFQVIPGVLVTAWHVLDDLGAGDVDPVHDLAVLSATEPLGSAQRAWPPPTRSS